MMQTRKLWKVVYASAISTSLIAALVFIGLGGVAPDRGALAQGYGNATASGTSNSTSSSNSTSMTNGTSGANSTGNSNSTLSNSSSSSGNSTTATNTSTNSSAVYIFLKGQISNVQLDTNGSAAWVQSGVWVLRAIHNDTGVQSAQLYARFEMIKPDGTAMHQHKVYAFKASNFTMSGNTTTLTGTATVTMPGGPVADVPVTIKILNQKLIAMTIGPDKVNGHFDNSTIYGTVTGAIRGAISEMQATGSS